MGALRCPCTHVITIIIMNSESETESEGCGTAYLASLWSRRVSVGSVCTGAPGSACSAWDGAAAAGRRCWGAGNTPSAARSLDTDPPASGTSDTCAPAPAAPPNASEDEPWAAEGTKPVNNITPWPKPHYFQISWHWVWCSKNTTVWYKMVFW